MVDSPISWSRRISRLSTRSTTIWSSPVVTRLGHSYDRQTHVCFNHEDNFIKFELVNLYNCQNFQHFAKFGKYENVASNEKVSKFIFRKETQQNGGAMVNITDPESGKIDIRN